MVTSAALSKAGKSRVFIEVARGMGTKARDDHAPINQPALETVKPVVVTSIGYFSYLGTTYFAA